MAMLVVSGSLEFSLMLRRMNGIATLGFVDEADDLARVILHEGIVHHRVDVVVVGDEASNRSARAEVDDETDVMAALLGSIGVRVCFIRVVVPCLAIDVKPYSA